MEGIIGDRTLRCSDGHLFVSGEGARLFLSLHVGSKRFIRCPVDKKWRTAGNVNSGDLTEQEIGPARQYRTWPAVAGPAWFWFSSVRAQPGSAANARNGPASASARAVSGRSRPKSAVCRPPCAYRSRTA
jgi:hypothetical protein